jgi:hypothetical protein
VDYARVLRPTLDKHLPIGMLSDNTDSTDPDDIRGPIDFKYLDVCIPNTKSSFPHFDLVGGLGSVSGRYIPSPPLLSRQ